MQCGRAVKTGEGMCVEDWVVDHNLWWWVGWGVSGRERDTKNLLFVACRSSSRCARRYCQRVVIDAVYTRVVYDKLRFISFHIIVDFAQTE